MELKICRIAGELKKRSIKIWEKFGRKMSEKQKIVVIGGGASGFFAALNIATFYPDFQVVILEKTTKLLSKVRVSGGGRCNVTNACFELSELLKHYPRGAKALRVAFKEFSPKNTVEWFEKRGVLLKTEPDNRIFPVSNSSETIIECFLNEAKRLNIEILMQQNVKKIIPFEVNNDQNKQQFKLEINEKNNIICDKIVVATGSNTHLEGFDWLAMLGHEIEKPVPSLFTFNIPKNPLNELMGVSLENANVRISKTNLQENGALLVTHWGLSGPAVLKTSAWGARELSEMNYQFSTQIKWVTSLLEEDLRVTLTKYKQELNTRQIYNKNPFGLPKRLWEFLLEKIAILEKKQWTDLSKQDINRLTNVLINDLYEIKGKTTFKEEFVTCGGVSLQDINLQTMESKKIKNLYFTGEVLDIDGVTGGFNFQAAWATAYLVARNIGS
jgi:predicted Rossmann fold flavoprotein